MKQVQIIPLSLLALLLLFPQTGKAQIPEVGDPVCAYCEVNLRTAESHKKGCPYYSEPEREEESSSPQPRTSSSQSQTSKPSTKLKDYTPAKEQPQVTWTRADDVRRYKRMYENGEISYDYMEYYLAKFEDKEGNYSVQQVEGKGVGIWFLDPDADYKTEMNKGWFYYPRYQRIQLATGGRAAMQLKTTRKWGIENLEKHETLADFEYDELKYFNESYPRHPVFFLNQKDEMGRDRWYLHDGNDFPLSFPFKSVELKAFPSRAYAQTLGGDWVFISGFENAPGNLRISGPFRHLSENTISGKNHLIISIIDENGAERYGIGSFEGQVLYNFEYDMIEHSPSAFANYVKVWKDGQVGVLELMSVQGSDGKTYQRYVECIKPQYDMFKTASVWNSKASTRNSYCVVGRQDRYALTTGDIYAPITLPTIYTLNEVELFAKRMFEATSDSRPFKETKDPDYKRFCEDRAISLYKQVTGKAITPQEVEEKLNEERLMTDYLHQQRDLHQRELKLGKYDEAKQTFEVHSPWGTVSLPVPKSEAESVKRGWKQGITDSTIRPCLQLDQDTYRPVMWNVQALVGGKYYGYREP